MEESTCIALALIGTAIVLCWIGSRPHPKTPDEQMEEAFVDFSFGIPIAVGVANGSI